MAAERASDERTEIAIAVVERDGQFLVGRRPVGQPLAGYWEFPGGKVRRGESPADAAARECLEETGLAIDVVGTLTTVEHDYEHGQLRLHFLAGRVRDRAGEPAGPFTWTPRAKLAELEFPPANGAVLALLAARGESADDAAADERR